MDKQILATLPGTHPYTVEPKHLTVQYAKGEDCQRKFNWDIDEPFVVVVREYLRYVFYKSFE